MQSEQEREILSVPAGWHVEIDRCQGILGLLGAASFN